MQTLGRNRDQAASEETPLFYTSTAVHPYVDECETLTLRVSSNYQPSAQMVIDLYYALGA